MPASRGERGVARASVADLPFASDQFDLVTSFDVLYALDDTVERKALDEMYRVLRPGGQVLINVAALKMLTGNHSVLGGEVRRYSRQELRDHLERTGFAVRRITYTNFLLLPLVALRPVRAAPGRPPRVRYRDHRARASRSTRSSPARSRSKRRRSSWWTCPPAARCWRSRKSRATLTLIAPLRRSCAPFAHSAHWIHRLKRSYRLDAVTEYSRTAEVPTVRRALAIARNEHLIGLERDVAVCLRRATRAGRAPRGRSPVRSRPSPAPDRPTETVNASRAGSTAASPRP